eukprot:gb/GECG01016125.1/.p1 GENE.gb/GECG01016125.1/~~gb/GECG01016125.1/.p1  ORF type:complete len:1245 (+),score=191.58 gb/GECG01016125.1/:1-3735(+)
MSSEGGLRHRASKRTTRNHDDKDDDDIINNKEEEEEKASPREQKEGLEAYERDMNDVLFHPQVKNRITKTLWLKKRHKWTTLDKWPFVVLYLLLIAGTYYFAVVNPSEDAIQQAQQDEAALRNSTRTLESHSQTTMDANDNLDDLFDSPETLEQHHQGKGATTEEEEDQQEEDIKPNMLVQMAPYDIRAAVCYFLIPVIACLQGLCFLLQEWSVEYEAFFLYRQVNSTPADADYVAIFPQKNKGKPAIIPLVPLESFVDEIEELEAERGGDYTSRRNESKNPQLFLLDFQHTRYVVEYHAGANKRTVVRPLSFPLQRNSSWYKHFPGLRTSTVQRLQEMYGDDSNDLKLPLPSFGELFKEHALAPFFVFQMFCVLLWCLDEYWYYSLFTLFMLVFLEATQVLQRLHQHSSLRQMRPHPAPVNALRDGQWTVVDAAKLLPGDIIQLKTKDKAEREAQQAAAKPENPLTVYTRKMREYKEEKERNPSTAMEAPKQPTMRSLYDYFTGKHSKAVEDDSVCPADVMLLEGQSIVNEAMLTGESIPHVKEAISTDQNKSDAKDEKSWFSDYTSNVIYGGTNIISCSGVSSDSSQDEYAKAVVLRTGYYTAQGDLMRTILFSSERVTVDNTEAYFFLLLLLFFAIIASSYVLYHGVQDESRSRFKLTLHCIMILTSVVPPELPLELSMAVSTSLGALTRQAIFCTEPFRIPMSGKVDTCCFDKTGTLTTEKVYVKGLVTNLTPKSGKDKGPACIAGFPLVEPHLAKANTTTVLAGCNNVSSIGKAAASKKPSLSKPEKEKSKGDMVGDPLEIAVLQSMGWRAVGHNTMKDSNSSKAINVLHRYPFSSALKRMCTVVHPTDSNQCYVCVKGAPEVIQRLLRETPEHYSEAALRLTAAGCRVLALAYKELDISSKTGRSGHVRDKFESREELEKDLTFVGFLVVDCPLKPSSEKVIRSLKDSNHRLIMITGDNAFTAAAVAYQCSLTSSSSSRVINFDDESGTLIWEYLDHYTNSTPERGLFDTSKFLQEQVDNYSLAVTGAALERLELEYDKGVLEKVYLNASVFARVSPTQKEHIITALNRMGTSTLMCGDGTNDVGALKQSVVGISIISNPDLESVSERLQNTQEQRIQQQQQTGASAPNQQLDKQIQELQKEMSMESQVAQFGDASIAAPFTSKKPSIEVVPVIIREGRRTLVTTHQMFRILAVNSLLASYQLSALSLYGVKSGDTQATISGMSQALFFYVYFVWKTL